MLRFLPNALFRRVDLLSYIHKSVPSFPEVTISYYAHGFAQLRLDARRHRDHQSDQFLLDCGYFVERKLIIAILIGPIALDKILEA